MNQLENLPMTTPTCHLHSIAVAVLLAAAGSAAYAGGTHGGSHEHEPSVSIGEPGKPGQASRTIEMKMYDSYFVPQAIRLKAGETVRFVVRNEGKLVHEFSIGTPEMHAEHQEEMSMMMRRGALTLDHIDHERMKMDIGGGHTLEHDDPNSLLLDPGQSGEITWHFPMGGDLEFACNVPGHYAAGMVGRFETH